MMYTSKQQVLRAIEDEDIHVGSIFSKPDGLYQITDLDGNDSDIIGHITEVEIDEEGNERLAGEHAITAVDLIKAEF